MPPAASLAAGFHAISATTTGSCLIQGRSWPTRPSLSGLRKQRPFPRRDARSNRMRMANCSMQPAQFRKSALGRAARGLLSCYHMPLRRRLQFAARLGDDLPSAP